MKNKLRKRVSAGLIISVLAVMAALLAVLAAKPHLRFTAGEYLGLNTRKVTVAKISPELEEVSVGALRGDSRYGNNTDIHRLLTAEKIKPLADKLKSSKAASTLSSKTCK